MKHSEKISTITYDGQEYEWNIKHWPSWCWTNENFNGLALQIQLSARLDKRQLIVNFPMERNMGRRKPLRQQPKIPDQRIIECIKHAMRLGWIPESRGKVFIMDVDNEPEDV